MLGESHWSVELEFPRLYVYYTLTITGFIGSEPFGNFYYYNTTLLK